MDLPRRAGNRRFGKVCPVFFPFQKRLKAVQLTLHVLCPRRSLHAALFFLFEERLKVMRLLLHVLCARSCLNAALFFLFEERLKVIRLMLQVLRTTRGFRGLSPGFRKLAGHEIVEDVRRSAKCRRKPGVLVGQIEAVQPIPIDAAITGSEKYRLPVGRCFQL